MMSKHTYRVHTDIVFDELGKSHTAYGIELLLGENNAVLVKDVFFDRDKAYTLVALCNNLALSPIHLMDVIEDAIE